MTGTEILSTALSFLTEKASDSTVTEFALQWLNLLLQEVLEVENSIRNYGGKEKLAKAQTLTDLSNVVSYSDELTRVALPYGIAALAYADDDNDYRAQDYRARYINALNDARKLKEQPIIDVYGGD